MNPAEPTYSQPLSEKPKFNWLVFFLVLFAPAVLTLLGAMAQWDGLAMGCPLIGGGIAGIVCGVMLARRVGRTQGSRILLGIMFIVVFALLSFAIGFAGCVVGGFKGEFR